jgi:hypothetical protein
VAFPYENLARVTAVYTMGPSRATCSLWLAPAGAAPPASPPISQLEVFAASVALSVIDLKWKNYRTDESTLVAAEVLYYSGFDLDLYSATVTESVAGLGGGSFPPQVSACQSIRTDASGRSRRGRLYLPYPGAAASDYTDPANPVLKPTVIADMANQCIGGASMTIGGVGYTWDAAIVSKKTSTWRYATSSHLDGTFMTQRRRAPRAA